MNYNKKLSVIIPTLYKKPLVLYKIIELLEKENVVSEIILIGNAPCNMKFPYTKKLKLFEPETNAFVYLSWNFGISIMENDNFLILNDDLLFPEKFCEKVLFSDIFDKEDTGLIGLDNKFVINFNKNTCDDIKIPQTNNNSKISFTPLDRYMELLFFASALFGRKENYYEVPEDFKIFYGDNYLLHQNVARNKINYAVSGFPVHHINCSSSKKPEFEEIRDKDIWAWANYTLNYINQNKY